MVPPVNHATGQFSPLFIWLGNDELTVQDMTDHTMIHTASLHGMQNWSKIFNNERLIDRE